MAINDHETPQNARCIVIPEFNKFSMIENLSSFFSDLCIYFSSVFVSV